MKWLRNMLRRLALSPVDIAWIVDRRGIPAAFEDMLRIMFRAVTTLSV
jgi:hypothetical protein